MKYYAEYPTVPDFGAFSDTALSYKNSNENACVYAYTQSFDAALVNEYEQLLSNEGFSYIGMFTENNCPVRCYLKSNIAVCTGMIVNQHFVIMAYEYKNNDNSFDIEDSKPSQITTTSELSTYLNRNMGKLQTPMGDFGYTIHVESNKYDSFPWDIDIRVDLTRSPWYDLKYNHTFSDSEKQDTINALRSFQEKIYNIVESYFPSSKLTGCYYSSYYKYPNLHVGYTSTRVFTWTNYYPDNTY